MGQPTPEVFIENFGRNGRITVHVTWTNEDSDDLDNTILIDQINDISGHYESSRFGILSYDWNSSVNVSGDVEFNSVPQTAASRVFSFASGELSGNRSFSDFPNGCVTDPNRNQPGDVVLTTRNALPGDELNITMTFKEKGIRRAPLLVV